jgi:hypothetical protein
MSLIIEYLINAPFPSLLPKHPFRLVLKYHISVYSLDKRWRIVEVLETEVSSIHPLALLKLLLTYALGKV